MHNEHGHDGNAPQLKTWQAPQIEDVSLRCTQMTKSSGARESLITKSGS